MPTVGIVRVCAAQMCHVGALLYPEGVDYLTDCLIPWRVEKTLITFTRRLTTNVTSAAVHEDVHRDKNDSFSLLGWPILRVPRVDILVPTAPVVCFRDGRPGEKAQPCTTGAEDGSEQSRHREPCRCAGSQGFINVFPLKAVASPRTLTSCW